MSETKKLKVRDPSQRTIGDRMLDKARNHTPAQHIKDVKLERNHIVDQLSMLRSFHKRFWLLEHIFRNYPIVIDEPHSFDPSEPDANRTTGILDVRINLPPLLTDPYYQYKSMCKDWRMFGRTFGQWLPWQFHSQWVFTVNDRSAFTSMSAQESGILISINKPDLKSTEMMRKGRYVSDKVDDLVEFMRWVERDADAILAIPIVEYENIYTAKTEFAPADVENLTRIWLHRWYPGLINRPMIWRHQFKKQKGEV